MRASWIIWVDPRSCDRTLDPVSLIRDIREDTNREGI